MKTLIAVACLGTMLSACSASAEKHELKAEIVSPSGVSMGSVTFGSGEGGV